LKYLFRDLARDKDVVLAAVRNNGNALQYVPEVLRRDKDVALEAVASLGLAFVYVPEVLRRDKDVVLAAINTCTDALKIMPDCMKDDKIVALAALNKDGSLIKYISERLRGDKDIVLTAVRHRGGCNVDNLKWASCDILDMEEVVLAAVEENEDAFEHASQRIKDMVTNFDHPGTPEEKLRQLKAISKAKSARKCDL
jgi:hypothetical protein